MRLHMILGHFNVQKLKVACELYRTDYKDQIESTDKLYWCPCSISKARRNALSRNPHRIIESTADSKQGGDTSVTTSKNSPTEGKLASTITTFGYLVFTDVLYLNETSFKDEHKYVPSVIDCASRHCTLYHIKKRRDIYNKLKEYIVWVKTLSNVSDVTIAYSVKVLHADTAAEYESNQWHSICENGIQTKYANPTQHEDAAVPERVRGTIQDAGRVLMYTAKIS